MFFVFAYVNGFLISNIENLRKNPQFPLALGKVNNHDGRIGGRIGTIKLPRRLGVLL